MPRARIRPSLRSRVEDAAEILLGVDVVDHPDVEVVGPELLQLGFERRAGLFRIARAEVLVLLPDGAEVPLNDEIPAAAFESGADVFAQLRVRRVDVDEVDAAGDGEVEIRADFSGALLHESLASECYGTHAQARSAQYSVLHIVSVSRWMMTAQRYVEKSDSERPELRILLPIFRMSGCGSCSGVNTKTPAGSVICERTALISPPLLSIRRFRSAAAPAGVRPAAAGFR